MAGATKLADKRRLHDCNMSVKVGVVRIETLLDVLVDGEDCKIHVLNCRVGGFVYQGDLYICYTIMTVLDWRVVKSS